MFLVYLSYYYSRYMQFLIWGKPSIPLIEKMNEDSYNLTITGTIRKNKTEIPCEMIAGSKEIPNSKFCFNDKITLLSFTPKKNKIVLLASSFMSSTDISNGKPDLILHYNKTKGGTILSINCVIHLRLSGERKDVRCEYSSVF